MTAATCVRCEASAPLVHVVEIEAQSNWPRAGGPWPRQTQAGGLPFPFVSTLDLVLGPSVLLGWQEGVEVTCGQVGDFL